LQDLWKYLKDTNKPIILYGTGNGAEKIIKMLDTLEIKVSGIFASDGFVKGKVFSGFEVLSYSQIKEIFPEMIVLVCFGSDRPEVISRIKEIAAEQELYMPDVPVITEDDGSFDVFDSEYQLSHINELNAVEDMLADKQSKEVFENIINFRKTGIPAYLFDSESSPEEMWSLLKLTETESYLDLGAYTGDTIADFLEICGNKYSKIYAFEPDLRNFRKLSGNVSGIQNCEIHNIAVSNTEETLLFAKNSGRGGARNGKIQGRTTMIEIPANSVDNIIGNRPCSVIKFDVEGQERKAIDGAENTILRNKPKMIIAAYHRTEDIFAIPLQIHKIRPDYKLYLRHSPCFPAWEVNYIFV